jgi:hypothetical protein
MASGTAFAFHLRLRSSDAIAVAAEPAAATAFN